MTTLPDHMIKIRDEASISFPVNISKIDSKNFTLSDIFKKGFNKCYAVMAEFHAKGIELPSPYEENTKLQQQLAEKDKELNEARNNWLHWETMHDRIKAKADKLAEALDKAKDMIQHEVSNEFIKEALKEYRGVE